MPTKPVINPRAAHWRALKVAKAAKTATTRALEKDIFATDPVTPRKIKQRAMAHAFWRRQYIWDSDRTPVA